MTHWDNSRTSLPLRNSPQQIGRNRMTLARTFLERTLLPVTMALGLRPEIDLHDANSRMDKSDLLFFLYPRVVVATIEASRPHRGSRDWSNGSHPNNVRAARTSLSGADSGVSGP